MSKFASTKFILTIIVIVMLATFVIMGKATYSDIQNILGLILAGYYGVNMIENKNKKDK
jgi:hypothetical protein